MSGIMSACRQVGCAGVWETGVGTNGSTVEQMMVLDGTSWWNAVPFPWVCMYAVGWSGEGWAYFGLAAWESDEI